MPDQPTRAHAHGRAMERILVALDAHDREEAFEITRDVEEMMSLVQLLTPDLPPVLLNSMREATIMRAAQQVVKAQARRRDIRSFLGTWSIRRVPSSIIPLFMFPSLAETSQ